MIDEWSCLLFVFSPVRNVLSEVVLWSQTTPFPIYQTLLVDSVLRKVRSVVLLAVRFPERAVEVKNPIKSSQVSNPHKSKSKEQPKQFEQKLYVCKEHQKGLISVFYTKQAQKKTKLMRDKWTRLRKVRCIEIAHQKLIYSTKYWWYEQGPLQYLHWPRFCVRLIKLVLN